MRERTPDAGPRPCHCTDTMRARDQPILARSLCSVEARATHIFSSSSFSSTQPSPAYGASASRCLSVSWPHLVAAARGVAARGRRRADGEGERKDETSLLAGGRSRTSTLMATAEDGECRETRAGGAFPLRVSVLAGGVLEERGGRRRADDSAASHRIAVVRQASAERGGNPSFQSGSRARGGRDEGRHLLHRTRSRAYVTLAQSGTYIPNSVLPSGEREEGVEELKGPSCIAPARAGCASQLLRFRAGSRARGRRREEEMKSPRLLAGYSQS
jgi:hypothetical protein